MLSTPALSSQHSHTWCDAIPHRQHHVRVHTRFAQVLSGLVEHLGYALDAALQEAAKVNKGMLVQQQTAGKGQECATASAA